MTPLANYRTKRLISYVKIPPLREFWHRVVPAYNWIKITQISGRFSFTAPTWARQDEIIILFWFPQLMFFQYIRLRGFQSKIYIMFL